MSLFEKECELLAGCFAEMGKFTPVMDQAVRMCVQSLRNGGKVMFCGNGGSASQAQHLAAELVGRYKLDRPAMSSVSLTVDTSILTAVGNDYGYDEVFARQVEGIGKSGDVLVGLSTSGNSPNVVKAFELAKGRGIRLMAFTGAKANKMAPLADIVFAVPSTESNHIQEMHLVIGHFLCGEIEKAFYGEKGRL